MNIILGAILIFTLRLIDQTLGTLRLLYVNKGKPGLGAVLGFVESGIWVVAISRVIQDLNDPLLIIGYALGFAMGTIVGSYIESSIAIGDVVEFTQRNGTVVQGTVRKKAIKNVTVETSIGNWKVPAHMLTIV